MKRGSLPETWEQKLCKFSPNEEYLFVYKTDDELKKAKLAIEKINKKKQMHFRLFVKKNRFIIIRDLDDNS